MPFKNALLLIDFQNDFLQATGRFPVAQSQVGPMLETVNNIIEASPALDFEIIYIGNEFSRLDLPANWFRKNSALEGSQGCQLDSRLKRVDGPYFSKNKPDAFSNNQLSHYLQARPLDRLILAGVYANGCVKSTARGALKRGFKVAVLSDGVAAASDGSRQATLDSMRRYGVSIIKGEDLLTGSSRIFSRQE